MHGWLMHAFMQKKEIHHKRLKGWRLLLRLMTVRVHTAKQLHSHIFTEFHRNICVTQLNNNIYKTIVNTALPVIIKTDIIMEVTRLHFSNHRLLHWLLHENHFVSIID